MIMNKWAKVYLTIAYYFQESDPDYAESLLAAAKDLFEFADLYRDDYQNSIPEVTDFYQWANRRNQS